MTIIFSLMSCASSVENSEKDFQTSSINVTSKTFEKDFQIGYVNSEQTGCGAYYTYDSILQDKETKYLFITDFTGIAIVNINKKDVSLKLDTTNKKKFIEVWVSNSYTIELNMSSVEQYEEGSLDKGTMVVKNNNKAKTVKVQGYSGC